MPRREGLIQKQREDLEKVNIWATYDGAVFFLSLWIESHIGYFKVAKIVKSSHAVEV